MSLTEEEIISFAIAYYITKIMEDDWYEYLLEPYGIADIMIHKNEMLEQIFYERYIK